VDRFIRGDSAIPADVLDQHQELRAELKSFDHARAQARFLPFMASAVLAVRPRTAAEQFDHILVDEAQDVRPLEWRVLAKFLKPGGTFSLFGDINQRHFDSTRASWYELADELELTNEDGSANVEELRTGYRSTRQILKFANQLLPRGERGVDAIQEGVPPSVERVGPNQLRDAAVRSAIGLSERHREGLTALISVNPQRFSEWFGAHGWRRPDMRHAWAKDERTIVVLHPEAARGLEFDGVVVVEPADFPENVGRMGPLYTSLTRATKELVVVHSRAMPKELSGKAVRRQNL
jgi:DNA helicase IV